MNILSTPRRKAFVGIAGAIVLAATASTAFATTAPTTPAGTDAAPTGSESPAPPFTLEAVSGDLAGSGATFPQAFYNEAIAELETLAPDLTIEYSGGGSGTGRSDLAAQLKDFAGTDAPVKEEDIPTYKGGEFVYVPTVLAPITLSYNLDGVDTLNLTPSTIAKIFQLQITNWNDEAIAADNPDATLPDEPIVVVRRADGSGTTENFSHFLDNAVGAGGDGTWTLGYGSELEWPDGTQAGDGNGGVAQLITDTPGSIGYVDLSDAIESGFAFANVQNKAGNFVAPTLEATTAAATNITLNDDGTFFTGWADGDDAYPIAAQTWIIVYTTQPDADTAAALQYFLTYLVSADGQALAQELNYAPLPAAIRDVAMANIAKIGA